MENSFKTKSEQRSRYRSDLANKLYQHTGLLSMDQTEHIINELEQVHELKFKADVLEEIVNSIAKIMLRHSKGESMFDLCKEFGIQIPTDDEEKEWNGVSIMGERGSTTHGSYRKVQEGRIKKFFCPNDTEHPEIKRR